MNAPNELALTAQQEPEAQQSPGSTFAMMMNGPLMDRLMAFSEMMAKGFATVPKHLQGKPADCLAVVLQATRWNMDPYVVGQKTHVVNGTLGYEAQLVHAVLKNSGAITGAGFKYEFRGEKDDLSCRVGAVLAGERELTWGPWLRNGDVTVRNSPLWKTNPSQQLGYRQVANWARMFAPGAILGVYTVPELEESTAPKDMGAAEVVHTREESAIPPGLLAAATQAARAGVAAYQKFWQATGAPNRKLLADKHEGFKDTALAADAARTVDNTPPPAAATTATTATASPPAGAPVDPATGVVSDPFMDDYDKASAAGAGK